MNMNPIFSAPRFLIAANAIRISVLYSALGLKFALNAIIVIWRGSLSIFAAFLKLATQTDIDISISFKPAVSLI